MIKQLAREQVQRMTLAEKDRWWHENVWRGDMPQLNLRSALTGAILGGILCLSNLYVGIKTGWSLGVGVTSVILSYTAFKLLSKMKAGREMTILENNAMQSCATAAGYMSGALVASIPAYMMITGIVIPMWQVITWTIGISLLGVLYAFPLKRRFINDEQHDFPEGKACGVVLDGLHSDDPKEGIFKSRILLIAGALAAGFTFFRSEKILERIHLKFLTIPEYLEDLVLRFTTWRPKILGSNLQDLTIGIETDLALFAAGGLMSVETGVSLLLGGFINFFILAPYLISIGIIPQAEFRTIVMWSLWGGVAMMTTASLFSFFSKPQMLVGAFRALLPKKGQEEAGERSADREITDIMKRIELPMGVFVLGIPIVGALVVLMAKYYFGVAVWLGVIAIPLIFVFTLVAVNSTALTSITPTGALGKLTQVTYAVLAPGNITTNVMTAGITGEAAGNASNLCMDIKPGFMLGAKPRHQAMAHVIGAVVGICVAVPVFYAIFHGDISRFGTKEMALPGALTWKAVADVLMGGLSALHPTAQVAVVIGAVLGILMEAVNVLLNRRAERIERIREKLEKSGISSVTKLPKPRRKLPVSAVGISLAFILPFSNSLIMAAGAILFGLLKTRADVSIERKEKEDRPGSLMERVFAEQETLCGGLVAGAALMGILTMFIVARMK